MALLAPNGYTTRAYYGTDCRAQALLVGAAISIGLTLWHDGAQRQWFSQAGRRARDRGRARDRRALDDHVGDHHLRLQRRLHGGQPGRGRRRARLRGGAHVHRRALLGAAALAPVGPHLLRRLPLVLAGAARHDRPAAALGRLPALLGPRRHHGGHRRPQLRPDRNAHPPGRPAALALVGGGPGGGGDRHLGRGRLHAGAGGGDRAAGRRPQPAPDHLDDTTTTTARPVAGGSHHDHDHDAAAPPISARPRRRSPTR